MRLRSMASPAAAQVVDVDVAAEAGGDEAAAAPAATASAPPPTQVVVVQEEAGPAAATGTEAAAEAAEAAAAAAGPSTSAAVAPAVNEQQQQPPKDESQAVSMSMSQATTSTAMAAPVDAATAAATAAAAAAPLEAAACLVCLEPMESDGDHRAAALRCGHIFGMECIKEWLSRRRRCPNCNARALKRDVTPLFNLPAAVVAAAPPAAAPPGDAAAAAAVAALRAQLDAERARRETQSAECARLRAQVAAMAGAAVNGAPLAMQPPGGAAVAGGGGISYRLPPAMWGRSHQHQQQQQQQYHQYQQQHQHQHQQAVPFGLGPGLSSSFYREQHLPPSPLRPPLPPHFAPAAGPSGHHYSTALAGARRGPPAPLSPPARGPKRLFAGPGPGVEVLDLTGCDDVVGGGAGSGSGGGGGGMFFGSGEVRLGPLPAAARWHVAAPGRLRTVQTYACSGSRAFCLQGRSALVIAESVGGSSGGGGLHNHQQQQQRLRKVSVFMPHAATYIPLPSGALARAIAPQPGGPSGLVAVATQGAGLVLASLQSDTVVHRAPAPGGAGSVWSVAWAGGSGGGGGGFGSGFGAGSDGGSAAPPQQLYLGLEGGRMALFDLRMTGREHGGVVATWAGGAAVGRQPLLALAPLSGGGGASWGDSNFGGASTSSGSGSGAACIVATPGGVFAWSERGGGGEGSSDGGGAFTPLIEARARGGGSCESIAMAELDGGGGGSGSRGGASLLLAASFRSALLPNPLTASPGGGGTAPAAHELYGVLRAPSAAPGMARGTASQPAAPAALRGHASAAVVTAGAFARVPALATGACDALAFVSGDEAGPSLAVWDCANSALIAGAAAASPRGGAVTALAAPPPRFPGPVVQVATVDQGGGGVARPPLIAALCSSQLQLCAWDMVGGGVGI